MDFKVVLLSQDKTQTHNLDMYGVGNPYWLDIESGLIGLFKYVE
jgi:hypothetical protein